MNPTDAPVIELKHVSRYFPVGSVVKPRHVHAVEDVSFQVMPGQVVAIVGESGSGKSTTIRLVARLMPVTAGSIEFHGQDIFKAASLEYRRKVQMIFQDPFSSLNPVHTIEHHLARPLQIHHMAPDADAVHTRIIELLETVGLNPAEEIAARYPYQLSGGQRQRVAIARALAVEPELILADEPISMLDVSIRIGILNLMNQLKEERGLTYVYITHDLASARYIGDMIQVMYAGHMVEGGPSEEVMRHPAHPYTRLLLSAVPDPHAGLRTDREQTARGEVPVLIDPPPGCPFAARCKQVKPICRAEMPAPTDLASGSHWTRCHAL